MINSIQVPSEFVALASEWYCGSGSMLYAIASTGNLTIGQYRPRNMDTGLPMTDLEWYSSLYFELSCELGQCLGGLRKYIDPSSPNPFLDKDVDSYNQLMEFEKWADQQVEKIDAEVEAQRLKNETTNGCVGSNC